jgi:hypothetical protein
MRLDEQPCTPIQAVSREFLRKHKLENIENYVDTQLQIIHRLVIVVYW